MSFAEDHLNLGEAAPLSHAASESWFAVQTRPAHELIAETEIRSFHLETLLPRTVRLTTRPEQVPKRLPRALFPGYLFAKFCPEISLRAVRYARGVVRVLGGVDCPCPVEDVIIESLRERMDARGLVALAPPALAPGASVRIHSGPLAGWSGVFERDVSDSRRVVILLEALQCGRAVVWRDWVEPATA